MSYKLIEVPNIAKSFPICASGCMMHEIRLMSNHSTSAISKIADEEPRSYRLQMADDTVKAIRFSQRRCENIAILDGNGDAEPENTMYEISDFFTQLHSAILTYLPEKYKNKFLLQNKLNKPVYANLEPRKIETIIYNLISNSMYHGKADRIYLGFCVKNDKLSFWVRDNGIGILTDLSDANALVDASSGVPLTLIPPGFKGIGLSVCRHYTDLMQGSIKYCNQKMGVKFIVTLPLTASDSRGFHQTPAHEFDIYYMRLAFSGCDGEA